MDSVSGKKPSVVAKRRSTKTGKVGPSSPWSSAVHCDLALADARVAASSARMPDIHKYNRIITNCRSMGKKPRLVRQENQSDRWQEFLEQNTVTIVTTLNLTDSMLQEFLRENLIAEEEYDTLRSVTAQQTCRRGLNFVKILAAGARFQSDETSLQRLLDVLESRQWPRFAIHEILQDYLDDGLLREPAPSSPLSKLGQLQTSTGGLGALLSPESLHQSFSSGIRFDEFNEALGSAFNLSFTRAFRSYVFENISLFSRIHLTDALLATLKVQGMLNFAEYTLLKPDQCSKRDQMFTDFLTDNPSRYSKKKVISGMIKIFRMRQHPRPALAHVLQQFFDRHHASASNLFESPNPTPSSNEHDALEKFKNSKKMLIIRGTAGTTDTKARKIISESHINPVWIHSESFFIILTQLIGICQSKGFQLPPSTQELVQQVLTSNESTNWFVFGDLADEQFELLLLTTFHELDLKLKPKVIVTCDISFEGYKSSDVINFNLGGGGGIDDLFYQSPDLPFENEPVASSLCNLYALFYPYAFSKRELEDFFKSMPIQQKMSDNESVEKFKDSPASRDQVQSAIATLNQLGVLKEIDGKIIISSAFVRSFNVMDKGQLNTTPEDEMRFQEILSWFLSKLSCLLVSNRFRIPPEALASVLENLVPFFQDELVRKFIFHVHEHKFYPEVSAIFLYKMAKFVRLSERTENVDQLPKTDDQRLHLLSRKLKMANVLDYVEDDCFDGIYEDVRSAILDESRSTQPTTSLLRNVSHFNFKASFRPIVHDNRASELSLLDSKVFPPESTSSGTKVVVVYGQTKIGKSTLVQQYVLSKLQTRPGSIKNLIWFDASDSKKLCDQLLHLCSAVTIDCKVSDAEQVRQAAELLYNQLLDEPTWIVFDDARQFPQGSACSVEDLLPSSVNWKIQPIVFIITKCSSPWMRLQPTFFHLAGLREDQMLKTLHLQDPDQNEKMRNIFKKLEYSPLLLSALQNLKDSEREDLAAKLDSLNLIRLFCIQLSGLPETLTQAFLTLHASWIQVFAEIRAGPYGHDAMWIYSTLALLEPITPVQFMFELFKRHDSNNPKRDYLYFGRILQYLQSWSLVKFEGDNIKTSRVLQHIHLVLIDKGSKEEIITSTTSYMKNRFSNSKACLEPQLVLLMESMNSKLQELGIYHKDNLENPGQFVPQTIQNSKLDEKFKPHLACVQQI